MDLPQQKDMIKNAGKSKEQGEHLLTTNYYLTCMCVQDFAINNHVCDGENFKHFLLKKE